MSMILDGRIVRDKIAALLSKKISKMAVRPTLFILQIGDRPDSSKYIRAKKNFARRVGVDVIHNVLPISILEEEIISVIKNYNDDHNVHGIIVQLPLPKKIDAAKILNHIATDKDVDGLTDFNMSKLLRGAPGAVPATARGVVELLDFYKLPVVGKKVLVIGRSNYVGKPIALTLLNEGATVMIAHSKTKNLGKIIKDQEIIISVVGKPNLISDRMVRPGHVIVDVGINTKKGKLEEEIENKKIIGDVDFEKVSKIVKAISPVPGGVGAMTVAALFENLYDMYSQTLNKKNG